MRERPYPTKGRHNYLHILDDAGYVEYSEFAKAKSGYFCRTCTKLDAGWDAYGPTAWCVGLDAPVAPHGCCNYWEYALPTARALP